MTTFTIATNEFRGGGAERTEYHPCVAWDRLAEIWGQFLSRGRLVAPVAPACGPADFRRLVGDASADKLWLPVMEWRP